MSFREDRVVLQMNSTVLFAHMLFSVLSLPVYSYDNVAFFKGLPRHLFLDHDP